MRGTSSALSAAACRGRGARGLSAGRATPAAAAPRRGLLGSARARSGCFAAAARPLGFTTGHQGPPEPARRRARDGSRPARVDSADVSVLDILALGTEVEVLHPTKLRTGVREAAAKIAALHSGPEGSP